MTNHAQHIDEVQLISRLKARDKEAFGYLYDNYSAAIFGVISRIVKNDTVAEEVLHDAFIKVWNSIVKYDSGKGRLFTWMYNIARNLAIDKLRSKEIKQEGKTDSVSDNVHTLEQQNYSEQEVDSIGIENLLKELTPDQQLIINLLYLKGYTQAEVSKEYNIPLGTVKTRHRLAMLHLRKIVGK